MRFFLDDSKEEAKIIPTLSNLFADCLGLRINHSKSAFVKFRLSHEEEDQCSRTLGTLFGILLVCHKTTIVGEPTSNHRLEARY